MEEVQNPWAEVLKRVPKKFLPWQKFLGLPERVPKKFLPWKKSLGLTERVPKKFLPWQKSLGLPERVPKKFLPWKKSLGLFLEGQSWAFLHMNLVLPPCIQ